MRRALSLLLCVLSIASLAGCGAGSRSAVADPRVGRVFYLCCNVHYDPAKPEITDAIPTRGSLIPFGTRVEVQKVTKDTVRFEAAGHPAITLSYDHAKGLPFSAYLNELFVTEDPRLKLKKVPAREVKLIEKGIVSPGMSRDQVLMALGYPPGDRTPSLDATTWTYTPGASEGIVVYFDGSGRVSSVQRQAGRRSR